jgi:hypothetical protein
MSETLTFADLFAGICVVLLASESVGSSRAMTSMINEKALGINKFQVSNGVVPEW